MKPLDLIEISHLDYIVIRKAVLISHRTAHNYIKNLNLLNLKTTGSPEQYSSPSPDHRPHQPVPFQKPKSAHEFLL